MLSSELDPPKVQLSPRTLKSRMRLPRVGPSEQGHPETTDGCDERPVLLFRARRDDPLARM